MSFWNKRTPCWELLNCPVESRQACGAYLTQHYPCWELPLAQRCPVGERIQTCKECPVYLTYNDPCEAEEKVCGMQSQAQRILVVDDELLIRWSLYQALRRSGFEVSLAGDVDEALAEVAKHFFRFVLIDMKLPGNDGFWLAEQLRTISPESRLTMMTAYGSEEVEARARELGMSYLSKPVNLDHIAEMFQ